MRVVAVVEATYVNGAVKALLGFAESGRRLALLQERELHLIAYKRGRADAENLFTAEVRRLGIPLTCVHERFAYDPQMVGQLVRTVAALQPDLLQTHASKSHFLVAATGLYRKHPWVAFHHGYTRTDFKNVVINQLDRVSLRRARRVFTDCAAFAPELHACGVSPSRVRVRHNCVTAHIPGSAQSRSDLRLRLGIGPDEQIVLAVGRLSHEKGHIHLLEAAAQLARRRDTPRFRLLIVGDGPERFRLEELARCWGLESVVQFAGSQRLVAPFYDISDVMVLPSLSEGSPNVLLEAMAAQVPVIATVAGGIPEIVRDGTDALLVPPCDGDALAAKIGILLQGAELRQRLTNSARQRVLEFTPEAYTRQLFAELTSVLSE